MVTINGTRCRDVARGIFLPGRPDAR
jgi:hypothetical protein